MARQVPDRFHCKGKEALVSARVKKKRSRETANKIAGRGNAPLTLVSLAADLDLVTLHDLLNCRTDVTHPDVNARFLQDSGRTARQKIRFLQKDVCAGGAP
jgi:hypothetical protein